MRCRSINSIRAAFISERPVDKFMPHAILETVGRRLFGIYPRFCQLKHKRWREEIPNPRHQIPAKFQRPIIKMLTRLNRTFGNLEFGISLEPGFWDLGFTL